MILKTFNIFGFDIAISKFNMGKNTRNMMLYRYSFDIIKGDKNLQISYNTYKQMR